MTDDVGGVIDALPGLIWTGFPDGRIDFVNRRWREYTGFEAEEGCGTGWQRAVHPDDLPDLLDCLRTFANSHDSGGVEIEARLRRFDGEYRWFLFQTSALSDPSGRAVKWCGVGTDIDARKQLEETILASAQALHAHPWTRSPSGLLFADGPRERSGADGLDGAEAGRNGMPIVAIAEDNGVATAVPPAIRRAATPLRHDAWLGAIRGALERRPASMADVVEMQVLRDRYVSLSRREREVMALVVSGLLNKQVGGVLGISEITVKAHRGRVMRKMKAESLADLVTMGGRLGLRSQRVI
jgi:PAS domain S-box-containing protein